MNQPAIECQGLSKAYRRGHLALNELNLRVQPGQVYGFLGPNGAGKTTTIRLLLDLTRPTQGNALIFGQSVYRNPQALGRVGALVEGASFYPYLNAWDNLMVLGRTMGNFDPARAAHLLDLLGLAPHQRQKVGKYSTGMQQRLGIAAALLHNPDLLILDEPGNGLDPQGIHALRRFIRQLVETEGKTVFLSSHLLNEVQHLCDRVAIIHQGKLIAEGTVSELLNQGAGSSVLLELASPEAALALLSERWTAQITPERRLMLQVDRAQIPDMLRYLLEQGIDVFAVQAQQPSLEDYFLSLTQGVS